MNEWSGLSDEETVEQRDSTNEWNEVIKKQWTTRVRKLAVSALPPSKLLPDTQPIYVASWIYTFGVLTLSALVVVAISGAILAIEGPSWWHSSPEGLFVNSLHLWSVELFFFFMVVHLWGKFYMAAWRGRRALTWITGVVAFVLSIGAAFTGYLSQQNFASQWIATQSKDGLNSVGIGAFFNVMNFGQMFMWHILLLPLLVVVVAGLHMLLVRFKGVVPPIGTSATKEEEAKPWKGATRPYDILKEAAIAFVVISLLTVGLSVVFSSPDEPPLTIKKWSNAAPLDFVTTAASELDGTSASAAYGAPYNNTPDTGQKIGPISLQNFVGVHIPINAPQDFVLMPLSTLPQTPALALALSTYRGASSATQTSWNSAYGKALGHAKVMGETVVVPPAPDGPVPTLMANLLSMGQAGALDGALESSAQFYGTDYTRPLLFMADGSYLGQLGEADHLLGTQWGMTNETGNFPGQAWLWLYTFWYQIPPFRTSGNADALVWAIMMLLTLTLALVPVIPGLRKIPEKLPIYRLIWRDYYNKSKKVQ